MKLSTSLHCAVAAVAFLAMICGCGQSTEVADSGSSPTQTAIVTTKPLVAQPSNGILGNPDILAFSYGGYRGTTRDEVPTVAQLKEDMKVLSAMGVKLLRTYNTQQYEHAANLLEAIEELREADAEFEMFVMLGAWIDCEGAWTNAPNHEAEDVDNNTAEINAAVALANKYPKTVKMIAVGNESMVHWATTYFVRPGVILKWVNHLQGLKKSGELPSDVWITSSDNFASWGGGDASYRTKDLEALIAAVDFVSLHTYPFHDTHYESAFWVAPSTEADLSVSEKAESAIGRAMTHSKSQYQNAVTYIKTLGLNKPVHIGETGWASIAGSLYGKTGSQAADEYKAKLFYDAMRNWTKEAGMSCFFFEAFDEQWKDPKDEAGSENHFGLIDINGQAKYTLWDQVDAGIFDGLTRNGAPITKTFDGDEAALMASILTVPNELDLGNLAILTVNDQRQIGESVTEGNYVVLNQAMVPDETNDMAYPSAPLKLNVWEGTCGMEMSSDKVIRVNTGTGPWWGCGLEIQASGKGENLSEFKTGQMHFEIKGSTKSHFTIGFQTGVYTAGTQTNNYVAFGPGETYELSEAWKAWEIPMTELIDGANLTDVTAVMFVRGDRELDGKQIEIRNVHFSKN